MQNGFFTVDYQCVTCIVSALIANNILCTVSKQIYYFTFSLVTPLGAKDHNIFSHESSMLKN